MNDVSQPLISVIIPAYNAESFIADTLKSVISQTYTNWEVIVVDDCSTDGTLNVVKGFSVLDARIGYRSSGKNFGGPAGPRNIGVHDSQADWVAFLDADDIWHPDKLQLQIDAAIDNNATLVCSAMLDFPENVSPLMPRLAKLECKELSYMDLLFKNQIATSSVLCHRKAFDRAGCFNELPEYKAVEDYDLWLRVCLSDDRVVKLQQPLLLYRIVKGSISRSKYQQVKKVLMVVRNRIKIDRPFLLPLLPVFAFTYFAASAYFRIFKKGL